MSVNITETLYGRRVIYTDCNEITKKNLLSVLEKALSTHGKNRGEIQYLYDYYKGKQPIRNRTKEIRPEINNKIVVNRANEIVSFKVSYLMGEPVQYTYFVMQTDCVLSDVPESFTVKEVSLSTTAFAAEPEKPSSSQTKTEEPATAGTALPADFKTKSCAVQFIGGAANSGLRIAITYDALGFKPVENAFANTYVKGTLKDATGKSVAFTGKILSNDVRDTYFVMQTDYVLSDIPENFSLKEITISKTAF